MKNKFLFGIAFLLCLIAITAGVNASEITCSSCQDCTDKLNGSYDKVVLDQNIVNHTGNCIDFSSNNTVFDCNGHIIGGDWPVFDYGIKLTGDNSTIMNCSVGLFYYGIWLSEADNNTIYKNNLYLNGYSGLTLTKSHYNTLEFNTIGFNSYGLAMLSSNYTKVNNNNVCGNLVSDIWQEASMSNSGDNNTCYNTHNWNDNGTVDCTYSCCLAPYDNMRIEKDTKFCPGDYRINDTGEAGVVIINSSNVTLDCKNANLIGGHFGVGIINRGFDNVTIKNCNVSYYGVDIGMNNNTNNYLLNNYLTASRYGLYLYNVNDSHFEDNKVSYNNEGLDILASHNNVFASNEVCANIEVDIRQLNSTGNYGINNSCNDTKTEGWNDTGEVGCTYACLVCNDYDVDGVCDDVDNCIYDPNSNQNDTDSDGVGDVCDNCPSVANTDQKNADYYDQGDACDNCWYKDNPGQTDHDGDCAALKSDPTYWDGQKWLQDPHCGDSCDNCWPVSNPDQKDSDHIGLGHLLAYWKFDDCTGNDSVGTNDGSLNGPDCVNGRIGSALNFNGSNDYVDTPLNLNQSNSTAYTMQAWVYPTSVSSGMHQVISTDNGGYDWSILRYGDDWKVFTGKGTWTTGFKVDANIWQHVAAVFIPGEGIKFYKNGKESNTTGIGYTPDDSNISIGRNPIGGGSEYFDGIIDEVAIYDRELSHFEIYELYIESLLGHDYLTGDGVGDACDNCWSMRNSHQYDYDGDCEMLENDPNYNQNGTWLKDPHCGNACDNCWMTHNPYQEDDDNDGVGEDCDNCPGVYNPTQKNSDPDDGVGDACDNCWWVANPDQYDKDGDCSELKSNSSYWDMVGKKWLQNPHCGDSCDNCPDNSNPYQEDFDNDRYGDACDCDDVFEGEYEDGIDCSDDGSPCPACIKPPTTWNNVTGFRLRGAPNSGFIDLVFVPVDTYQGDMTQFETDVTELVRNGYFNLHLNTTPQYQLPTDYKDKFNFYIYTGGFAIYTGCSGDIPTWTLGDIPGYDAIGVLNNSATGGGGCADKLGPPCKFKAQARAPKLVLHESGHAVFGLIDEYCGRTWYPASESDLPPESNAWLSNATCKANATNEGWVNGTCRQIMWDNVSTPGIDCIKNVWRYDPDTPNLDWMIACGGSGPFCDANYRFWEADTRRIDYVLTNWGSSSATSGIFLSLHIDESGNITYQESEVVGGHPDWGMQSGVFRGEILSSSGEMLNQFGIFDPRIGFGAKADMDITYNNDTDFQLIIPFEENIKTFRILDAQTGEENVSVDLTDTLHDYCNESDYQGEDCQSLDLDNDGIFGSNDSCPLEPENYNGYKDEDGCPDILVDIKPGSCPNPLNLKSNGVLPIAILGTEDFDVSDIDPATVRMEGMSPLRWSYEDVSTPYEGEVCGCTNSTGDGYMDLTLKFDTEELIESFALNGYSGEAILNVTAELTDGTPVRGEDCIKILDNTSKGKSKSDADLPGNTKGKGPE